MSAIEKLEEFPPLESAPEAEPLVMNVEPLILSVASLERLKAHDIDVAYDILGEPEPTAQVIDITPLIKRAAVHEEDEAEIVFPKPNVSEETLKILEQKGDDTRRILAGQTAPRRWDKREQEQYDNRLVSAAANGDAQAFDDLIHRYLGFIRLKASNYFLAGGDSDDLLQEGLLGFYKAVRDFDQDKGASFRSFAELCITRQIITAVKTATRFKHAPLNTYVSFNHTPAGQEDGDITLGDALPGPAVHEPAVMVISTEELQSLVLTLGSQLSALESDALRLYLEGNSYEDMAQELSCDTKTIDNALQRVKRKIITHQKAREVLL